MSFVSRGFHGRRREDVDSGARPARPVRDAGLPRPLGRPDAAHAARPVGLPDRGRDRRAATGGRGRSSGRCRARRSPRDIHCVTKWTKLDTAWRGVSVDTLLEGSIRRPSTSSSSADGGYTTNLPLEDVTGGKAWVVFEYDGEPLEPEHGGPARMLVPHLYFWKSAKWVRGLQLSAADEPGFWERNGYHNYGDPWQEQRYWGD